MTVPPNVEPLWTYDVHDHQLLMALDRDVWVEWTRWTEVHHPLTWAVCDFGEAWVLRCYTYRNDAKGRPKPVRDHGDLITEDVVVSAPPPELVQRTKAVLRAVVA